IVDGIKLRAGLHLVALADIEFGHAAGLVGTDKDHVGLDPALKARILALLAAGKHRCKGERGQNGRRSRRSHVFLRSPKIKSRWTRSISIASRGACRAKRLCQMT